MDEHDDEDTPIVGDELLHNQRFLARFVERAHEWVGDSARIGDHSSEPEPFISIEPHHAGAAAIWVVGDRLLDVQIGDTNGRFELQYSEENLLDSIVRGVIRGDANEVRILGRSAVRITLNGGRMVMTTGFESNAAYIPLPGWRRWARGVPLASYTA